MTQGKITQNTIYLTVAYVIQKVLAFVYFAFLARFLGADNIGKYTFAISFTVIFSIIIDLGLSSVLVREIAKFKDKAGAYINNVLGAKLALSLVAYGLVVLFVNLLGYPAQTKELVYLAGGIMILDSFTLSFYAVLRGFQKIKFEGLGTIIHQAIVITIGFIFIKLELPLIYFIGVLFLASLFNFLYSFSLIVFGEKIKLSPTLNKQVIKNLFTISLPFALAGIFSRIYSYIDQVLLSKMAGDEDLGIYSVAYKLTFALQFIPAAFAASIFPAFSHLYVNSKDKLRQTFEKSLKYLTIIALPITLGTIVFARDIILTIYGQEYLASILPLQILIVTLTFIFINYPLGSLLNACDRQGVNTRNVGIAMVVNVILNLLLIPSLSYVGASLAALGSYFVLIVINFHCVTRVIDYDKLYLAKVFVKSLLAAGIMAILAIYFNQSMEFYYVIIPVALLYFCLLFIFRLLTKQDLFAIIKIFKNKK